MITAQDLERLQTKVEDAKKKKAEAEGALKQLMAQLKEEFEVSTLDEARKKLAEIQMECKTLAASLDAKMESLSKEFGL